jgi:hypothetical protein
LFRHVTGSAPIPLIVREEHCIAAKQFEIEIAKLIFIHLCSSHEAQRNAEVKRTHRKVMLVGLLFAPHLLLVSFFAREQPENHYVLQKADGLVRTAGTPNPAPQFRAAG